MQFGAWVAELRRARGLTQRTCAVRVGLSPQRWSQLERLGRGAVVHPTAATLCRVAEALGVPISEVMGAAGLGCAEGDLTRPFSAVYGALPESVRGDVDEMVAALYRRHLGMGRQPSVSAGAFVVDPLCGGFEDDECGEHGEEEEDEGHGAGVSHSEE